MTTSLDALAEARRAAASPLFANLEGDIGVSFEFFPPKTEKMEAQLWDTFRTLEPLAPRFVSVTYGAGGSTRERTHATVARIASESAVPPAAHLTCVEASRAEIEEVARGGHRRATRRYAERRRPNRPARPRRSRRATPRRRSDARRARRHFRQRCARRSNGYARGSIHPHHRSPTRNADQGVQASGRSPTAAPPSSRSSAGRIRN